MITHDARRSLSCGNNPVPSPWLATASSPSLDCVSSSIRAPLGNMELIIPLLQRADFRVSRAAPAARHRLQDQPPSLHASRLMMQHRSSLTANPGDQFRIFPGHWRKHQRGLRGDTASSRRIGDGSRALAPLGPMRPPVKTLADDRFRWWFTAHGSRGAIVWR